MICPECEDASPSARREHRARGTCLIDEQIRRLRGEKLSWPAIAGRLQLDARMVEYRARTLGLQGRKLVVGTESARIDATIDEMRKRGESYAAIAEQLGLTEAAVEKRASRLRRSTLDPQTRAEARRRVLEAPEGPSAAARVAREMGLTYSQVIRAVDYEPFEPSRRLPQRTREQKVAEFAAQLMADGMPEHDAWSRARECYAPREQEAA